MPITASLFAHIQNDAFLSGTYKLEGNIFLHTSTYLKHYIEAQIASGTVINPLYDALLKDMDYLVHIEQRIRSSALPAHVNTVAEEIFATMIALTPGQRILLPGGWANEDGGHAMIYEISRTASGYEFIVYNSGDGINYHAKKSSEEKELFNPKKCWSIPLPTTSSQQAEWRTFLSRLLKAHLGTLDKREPISAKKLYEEVLPSIVYVEGKEISSTIPDFAYTAGQFSGTCTQRVLHQMIKLCSPTLRDYQQFIFKFKMHSLLDYMRTCFSGGAPFTYAVRQQIVLAIENNLKILAARTPFTPTETETYFKQLTEYKSQVSSAPPAVIPHIKEAEPYPTHSLIRQALTFPSYLRTGPINAIPSIIFHTFSDREFLTQLTDYVRRISDLTDFAQQYVYLERLILLLPPKVEIINTTSPYTALTTDVHFEQFYGQLKLIQDLLLKLKNEWLGKAPIAKLNVLSLSALALQIDIHDVLSTRKGLPSFQAFTRQLMESIVGNQKRNPYGATNHPGLDDRFLALQRRFTGQRQVYEPELYAYFKALLNVDAALNRELEALYATHYGSNNTELHNKIREYKLESLYMVSSHIRRERVLPSHHKPLIDLINNHITYEGLLRRFINPLYTRDYPENPFINLNIVYNQFRVSTPLYPTFIPHEELSLAILKHKYLVPPSPAKQALERDVSSKTTYTSPIASRSTNHIQLHPLEDEKGAAPSRSVTEADILARIYFHLRRDPSVQIILTLEHFKRALELLAEPANCLYLEANLFQPGLLTNALAKPDFLPQFDSFIESCLRFFTANTLHTKESLFFLRLNYLVNRYLALSGNREGITRLQMIQEETKRQILSASDPEITYGLYQYLFLITMTRIELGVVSTEELQCAFKAFFYIQSNTKALFIEDSTSHKNDIECAIAQFQIALYKQRREDIPVFIDREILAPKDTLRGLSISGYFPVYNLLAADGRCVYQVNVLQGMLFQDSLAYAGLPLFIKNHPLIQQLGMTDAQQCFLSLDNKFIRLEYNGKKIKVAINNNQLTVQQEWTIDDVPYYYELQALTEGHLARRANTTLPPLDTTLPKALLGLSSNYWGSDTDQGVLTLDNKPRYKLTPTNALILLDDKGKSTPFALMPLQDPWASLLTDFESAQFLLHHQSSSTAYVTLPRFNLNFALDGTRLIHMETGEEVLTCPSPISPNVAGLVLAKESQQRIIIPVARFYATIDGAVESDVYPVVHDRSGLIVQNELEELHLEHTPLWRYELSAHYVSFRLKETQPIADNTADALYLAYIYLATHQPQQAWSILEDVRTRLGGLTGSYDELNYSSWIINSLPYIIAEQKRTTEKALHNTPSYVACKLKVLSMLCDALLEGKTFITSAPDSSENTANAHWDKLQHKQAQDFLTSLPALIYEQFTRFQGIRRHLEDTYQLSTIERARLLTYYKRTVKDVMGALAYEEMLITIEKLEQERQALLALKSSHTLSTHDERRLLFIEQRFRELKPVRACSTELSLKPINLSLPSYCVIKQDHLSQDTISTLNNWINNLPGRIYTDAELSVALAALSSTIEEEQLILHFPAYLQIVLGINEAYKKTLLDFCTKTLIAERHVLLEKSRGNKVLFCTIFYYASHNKSYIQRYPRYTFNELVTRCRVTTPPSLMVYEAVDIFTKVLATPHTILENYAHRPSIPVHSAMISSTPLCEVLAKSPISSWLDQYIRLREEYALSQNSFALSVSSTPDAFSALELLAGKTQLEREQKEIKLAKELIDKNDVLLEARAQLAGFTFRVDAMWDEALTLANEGPEDLGERLIADIERVAKKRPHLTKKDLYALYVKADLAYTIEKTGLEPGKARTLHQLIHHALAHGIQEKIINQIIHILTKAMHSGEEWDLVPALNLLTQTSIPGLDTPAIVLIQHEENIVLRPRQVSALHALLKTDETGHGSEETVEKIIPGGGKSKVVIPIVVQQKAQGHNLVIVEVPQALLATNHVDLNRTSQRLFGKSAYRFEFSRESACSSVHLEDIYNKFIEIMNTRSYLVTTGESMQSLELKYLELLFSQETTNEDWPKQVFWCDKILTLLQNHADVIIDEVHKSLWTKKKLNYTFGVDTPISPAVIQFSITLFQYIDTRLIKDAPSFSEDYDWSAFKNELAHRVLNESTSPLNTFIKRQAPETLPLLLRYLTNTAESTLPLISEAPKEIKEALAFFKQQISTVLPKTLVRRLNEHYGSSRKSGLSSIEETLAIPYEANNSPNERSRFADILGAINYACQMMFIKGVSKELLKEHLVMLKAVARQELLKDSRLTTIDETPTAKGFSLLWPDLALTLSAINLNDETQINALHKQLKEDKTLILELLQNQALKLISSNSGIIPSDSFNHVDLYHRVQGLSGTPTNHTTYHRRLKYDNTSSLGSDGYIIEVLHSKETPIIAVDYEDAIQFINYLLHHSSKAAHCRAIIDIKAAFQGVDNFSVAHHLASYIRTNQARFSAPLKHVLYFNEAQILCALDVNKPHIPIILKTTDVHELNRILGSTPNERFTYYDQAHTLGTDIANDEHAHALVLVDEKISLENFLQGSMRMRGLAQKQTIEIVVPTKLRELTREALIELFTKTEAQALLVDNLFAAKGQMVNEVRRFCLDKIKSLPSEAAQEKAKLAQIFKAFFMQNPSTDLFALYGALTTTQTTVQILNQYKEQILALWSYAHEKGLLSLTPEMYSELAQKLDKIIAESVPHCLSEYEYSESGVDLSMEVETQQMHQVQTMALEELYDPSLRESAPVDWSIVALPSLHKNIDRLNDVSISINDLLPSLSLFSPQLRLSNSYLKTHTRQTRYLDAFLKPVFLIWYHLDLETDLLHALVITSEDFEEIEHYVKSYSANNWISTTEETIISGIKPARMRTNDSYLNLHAQICFFNGNFNAFLNSEMPSSWLNENSVQKIEFFEKHLLPYRPDCARKLEELRVLLTQSNTEGFAYIEAHPYEDHTACDWSLLFPGTSIAQANEYKKMAEAFIYIHNNWQRETLTLSTIQHRFRLSLKSLSFVNKHLHYINDLSVLMRKTENEEGFISVLSNEKQRSLLESTLGCSIDDLGAPYPIVLGTLEERVTNNTCVYIDLVERLYLHPAIKNRQRVLTILQEIAQRNERDVKIMYKLLATRDFNQTLLAHILKSAVRDVGLTQRLLSLPSSIYSAPLLIELVAHCQNEEQIQQLLSKGEIPSRAIQLIINRGTFSQETILLILPHIKEEYLLIQVYSKYKMQPQIRENIYHHLAFSVATIATLIKNNDLIPGEELIKILQDRAMPIEKELLSLFIERYKANSLLMQAILLHPNATHHHVALFFKLHPCTPNFIYEIRQIKGDTIDELVLEQLAKFASEEAAHSQSSEWEDCAITLLLDLKKIRDAKGKPFPGLVISSYYISYNISFAFKLLKAFSHSIVKDLPITQMIEEANLEQLSIMADPLYTDHALTPNHILEKLYSRCTSPELIDTFTRRSDLTEPLCLALVNKPSLTEAQLLRFINQCKSADTVAKAYTHRQSTSVLKEAIHQGRVFSRSTFIAIVKTNLLTEAELVTLMQQASFSVDGNYITTMSPHYFANEHILLAFLTNPYISEGSFIFLLSYLNSLNSPTVYLNLIDKLPKYTSFTIWSALTDNLSLMLKKNLSAVEKSQWEECLIQLARQLVPLNYTSLINRILTNNEITPACALKLWNIDTTLSCPTTAMYKLAELATLEELSSLIEMSPWFSEDTLQLISTRCTTKQLIDQFLQRFELQATHLLSIMNQDEITSDHLLFILTHRSLDQPVFEKMCSHSKMNKVLRKAIYTHPLLTSALLENLLDPSGSIEDEEIITILDLENNNVDVNILLHIAKNFLNNNQIANKLIIHEHSSAEVVEWVLNSSYCSIDLIHKALSHSMGTLSLPILKKITAYILSTYTKDEDKAHLDELLLDVLFAAKNSRRELDILALFEKPVINAHLGLRIFSDLGASSVTYLPLDAMIKAATTEQLEGFLNPSVFSLLSDELIHILIEQCTNERLLYLLVNIPDLTNAQLLSLITKNEIKEEHLLLLLEQKNLDDALLKQVCEHLYASKETHDKVCHHPLFSTTNLVYLLEEELITVDNILYLLQVDHEVLTEINLNKIINKFANNLDVLGAILSHPKAATSQLLTNLAQKLLYLYSLEDSKQEASIIEYLVHIFTTLHTLNAEKELNAFVADNMELIPYQLKIMLLKKLGNSFLKLPMEKIIQDATQADELDYLISIPELTHAELMQLSTKELTNKQINQLLARKDITPSIANVLIAKPSFDGQFKNYPWINKTRIIELLSICTQFSNFIRVLNHEQLTQQDKESWLSSTIAQSIQLEKRAHTTENPSDKLNAALEKLKVKAFSHMMKAATSSSHKVSAQIAFELHQELSGYKEAVINKQAGAVTSFVAAIEKAAPALKKHRGYTQILLDILNVALSIVTVGIKSFVTNDWRFFKANTDSINVTNNIKRCLNELEPSANIGLVN